MFFNRQSVYNLCSSSLWLLLLFLWGRLNTGENENKLARSFNFTFRYIDEVLSLNNSRFGDFADRIYPIELEKKDTTDTYTCASYLDLQLEIDSDGRLRTKHYDKREDFNFPIVIFPFICSYILAAPAYEVYTSQLIRYSRACGSYQDLLDRGLLLTRKLLKPKGSSWLSWSHHHMLKRPLSQERYKILLIIYFLIYRNLLEFITFVQSYFHYL